MIRPVSLLAAFLSVSAALSASDARASQNEVQKLTANPLRRSDQFGQSVATDGDWMVVGAEGRSQSGRALFFQRNSSTGAWQQFQEVGPSASTTGFGNAVALQGRLAVIGSHHGVSGVVLPSAYVYRFDGTRWVEMQRLAASNGFHGDLFGDHVAVDDDEVAVGAPKQSAGNGAVYVFRWNGAAWVETQILHYSVWPVSERFGTSLALLDGILLVGAPHGTVGHAYVHARDPATGQYAVLQQLEAGDPELYVQFGNSLTLSRDFAIVGSHFNDTTYVFERRAGNVWIQTQRLAPIEGGWFGNSVRTDGESLVISSPLQADGGAITLYRLQERRWVPTRLFTAADAPGGYFLGQACAVSGPTIVGTDDQEGIAGRSAAGAAYVFALDAFALGAAPPDPAAGATLDLTTSGGRPGASVLLALIAVNGTPTFATIATGEFDFSRGGVDGSSESAGEWTVTYTVPAGLSGQTATLQSFGISERGRLEATNQSVVTFQ